MSSAPRRKKLARRAFLEDLPEVLAVRAAGVELRELLHLAGVDPALQEGDFLDTGDLQSLASLERLDELRRRQQRLVGAAVQPGDAAAEELDSDVAALE